MNVATRDLAPGDPPVNLPENAGGTIIPLTQPPEPHVLAVTARMKAGDEDAFSQFHGLYCDRLFRYLFVLCRADEQLARDLLQETMLKVVRSIRIFNDDTEFWNWLAAVARNTFLDDVRKFRRRPALHPISAAENASLPAPQESEIDAALLNALEHALTELPAEERALVEIFYFQSGTYRSLASEQDTSPKAIESRMARVRQKLRHAITRHLRYENS